MPAVADSLMDLIDELEHVYTLTVDGVRVGAAEDEDVLRQAVAQGVIAYRMLEARRSAAPSQSPAEAQP